MTTPLPHDPIDPGSIHRFVSPHYDDIALSCGGMATLLARNGAVVRVEVVFGEEPDPAQRFSNFAEEMHRGWGMSAGEVIAGRRAEEAAAARVMAVERGNLPFRDAIYRGDSYRSDEQLFGPPAAVEAGLPAALVASLGLPAEPDESVVVYAPLAIGHHVDHQLAFAAGAALARTGWPVRFYEDLPYALRPGAFEVRMAALERAGASMRPGFVVPVAEAWETKLDAIFAYPSQLETIFRQYVGVGTTRAEVSAVMRGYAELVGGGAAAERFWLMG